MFNCRYAVNNQNSIIDIKILTKEKKEALRPFTCTGCGGELVARLGAINEHHFAHKANVSNCSKESYLHNTAKKALYQTYSKSLTDKLPYIFQYDRPYKCNRYENQFGLICEYIKPFNYDLTKKFDLVRLETKIEEYVADVLVSSTELDRDILFEIVVTHACTEEKLNSGLPIIEIEIKSDLDIERLLSRELCESDQNVKLHNFQRKVLSDCKGGCQTSVSVFVIHKSQKSKLVHLAFADYKSGKGIRGKPVVCEYLGPTPSTKEDRIELFKERVVNAYFNGVSVKNCYLCRFHGGDGIRNAVFCKKYKQPAESNTAVNCQYFWPFKNKLQFIEADKQNKEYITTHGNNIRINAISDFMCKGME